MENDKESITNPLKMIFENHNAFGASSDIGSLWGTYSYFFLKRVGINAKKAKANKVRKFFGLNPIFSISLNVNPVWVRMKLFGINPK